MFYIKIKLNVDLTFRYKITKKPVLAVLKNGDFPRTNYE
jgi:hypothetical protein